MGPTGKGVVKTQPKAETPAAPSQPAPARQAALIDKLPETAADKAKLLADLYARLQTADDEAAAKPIAHAIERLWQMSGSDTVALLMQRALKSAQQKKFDLARTFLDTVVDLAPDYPEGFFQRANLHASQNNYQAAVGDLRRVLALEPNHYRALERLAQIWRETGNKKGAFRVVQQLLEVNPNASGAKEVFEELKKEVEGQGI